MNHDDAMKLMTAERYILGELEPSERDAFEEHFFECTICADDVRDSAKFAAGVRTSDARVSVPAVGRFNWWAVAASLLTVMVGYDRLVLMPKMAMQVPAVPAVHRLAAQTVVLDSPSRGPGDDIVVKVRRDEAIPITTVVPAGNSHPVYTCEVRDGAGKARASLTVTRAEANDPVSLVVPPGLLSSGLYKLVIRGGDREIASYPFTVEVR